MWVCLWDQVISMVSVMRMSQDLCTGTKTRKLAQNITWNFRDLCKRQQTAVYVKRKNSETQNMLKTSQPLGVIEEGHKSCLLSSVGCSFTSPSAKMKKGPQVGLEFITPSPSHDHRWWNTCSKTTPPGSPRSTRYVHFWDQIPLKEESSTPHSVCTNTAITRFFDGTCDQIHNF